VTPRRRILLLWVLQRKIPRGAWRAMRYCAHDAFTPGLVAFEPICRRFAASPSEVALLLGYRRDPRHPGFWIRVHERRDPPPKALAWAHMWRDGFHRLIESALRRLGLGASHQAIAASIRGLA